MMRVAFSPQHIDAVLTLDRAGDTLIVNGVPLDLSGIPDGATVPAEAIDSGWIVGGIHRIGGVLHVTVLLPHGADPSEAMAYPEPVTVTADGPIVLPRDPEPQEATHGND